MRSLSLLLFTLTFTTLNAQDTINVLDPVTISASLSPHQLSKTGRNILVVPGEALRQYPVNSIDELLRYLPGVEVQSRGPMGTQSNITLRGGTFQQVLIVIDGMRLNDPLTGHFNSYFPIAPEEIERIEILKGASSSIYGTEAVGGVIHIITKTFSNAKQNTNQSVSAQVASGQFGLRNAQAGLTLKKGKTILSGGLLQNTAEGQTLRGTKGFFNLSTLSVSATHSFNDRLSISYRSAYDDRAFNAQNFYTQLTIDTATERVITRWHQFSSQYQIAKHTFKLSAAYKNASDQFQLRKSAAANINRSAMAQVLLQHQVQLNPQTTLQTGGQWISRSVRSNNRGNHDIATAGVFAVLHQRLGKHLQLNPSLRTDWNEQSGWELIPQLNASYRYKEFQFRTSVGKTTRDADFTERFNNYQPSSVPNGSRVGNPFLRAETSLSYEAGVDYYGIEGIKLSGGWFHRFHQNLIDYISTVYADMPRQVNLTPGATYTLAKNIARVETRGVELDALFQKQIDQHTSLTMQVGAIWMKSNASDTTPSLYVSNHARLLINYSASLRHKQIAISLNGLYKERTPQNRAGFVSVSPSYELVNVRVDYFLMQKQVALFMQVDNFFNQTYADILGTVMPNRWITGGIKVGL